MSLQPVLQIVHVTDLHVRALAFSENQRFEEQQRWLGQFMTTHARRFNWVGWHEGTQGHYRCAPRAFSECVETLRQDEPEWFPDPSTGKGPPTWLLDTGDRTTFGDQPSLDLSTRYLQDWKTACAAPSSRELLGNHDAWASCGPGFNFGSYRDDLDRQRLRLCSRPEFQEDTWITHPLRIRIGSSTAEIQLYGLDSVHWDGFWNITAVGRIEPQRVAQLRETVTREFRKDGGVRHFRILATHHPVSYPYTDEEATTVAGIPKMGLRGAGSIANSLRNDRGGELRDSLIHLFLSGHTHCRYPGEPRDRTPVTSVGQSGLAPEQLQLVAGPLMFNKAQVRGKSTDDLLLENRSIKDFTDTTLDHLTCQADVLRFSADPSTSGELVVDRIQIGGTAGTEYRRVSGTEQRFVFHYSD